MTIQDVKLTIEQVKTIVKRTDFTRSYSKLEDQLIDLKGNGEVVNAAFRSMRKEILNKLDENVDLLNYDERVSRLYELRREMSKLEDELDDIIYLFFEHDGNYIDLEMTLKDIKASRKDIFNLRKVLREEKSEVENQKSEIEKVLYVCQLPKEQQLKN